MKIGAKWNRLVALALMAAFAVPSALSATATAKAAPVCQISSPTVQASDLLREIRGLANKLSDGTETLALSAGTNQLDWRTHSSYLNQAKDNINAIGARIEQLRAIRDDAHPWQQEALDRIYISALQAARRAESAIQYLNANQGWLLDASYQDNVRSLQSHAKDVRETAGNFLEYAKAKDKLIGWQERLDFD